MSWLTFVLLALVLIFAVQGFRKGMLRMAISMVFFLMVLGVTSWLNPYISDFVREKTTWQISIEEKCNEVLLEQLRQQKIPCGIVSATQKELSQAAMERLGLWKYFSFAVDCGEYGPKTNPHIYLAGAEKLGSAPCCTLVFEDALHAARTAKEAGFVTVGVWDPAGKSTEGRWKHFAIII